MCLETSMRLRAVSNRENNKAFTCERGMKRRVWFDSVIYFRSVSIRPPWDFQPAGISRWLKGSRDLVLFLDYIQLLDSSRSLWHSSEYAKVGRLRLWVYEKRTLGAIRQFGSIINWRPHFMCTSSLTIEAVHNSPDFGPSVISLNKHALWVCVTELYGYW